MTKFLILEFKNAGLFPLRDSRGFITKDKILDINGRREREYQFIEPITVHQVSNMLHVLFGERPKPLHRETVYPNNEYLYNKALESYLMIDSYKDERGNYYRQVIQTKKALHNAWSPEGPIYWERVNQYIGDLFDYFVAMLNKIFETDVQKLKFIEVVAMIRSNKTDDRIINLFDFLKSRKLSKIYDYIFNDVPSALNASTNLKVRLTVTNGLDKVTKLDGKILVPVSDEDIEKIRSNKGCATILDGGLILIKGVKLNNLISIHGYTPVKEISLEVKK